MEKLKEIAMSLAVDHLLPPWTKVVNTVKEVPKDVADMKDKLDKIQDHIHKADKIAAAEEGNSRDGIKAKVKQLTETSFRMEDIHEERQLGDDPGCVALPCKTVDFVKTMASRLRFAYMNEDVKSVFGGIKDRNSKSEDDSQMQSFRRNQNATFLNLRDAPSDLNGHCPNNLEHICAEIVEKCDGLPLAIVAIGGLLASEDMRDLLKWERFSHNLSSELEKNHNLTAVTTSYHDLPCNLKQCFLYFGIYPEDYEVECVRLIRQWVAEVFVKYEDAKTLEQVAEQYLNELIQRSLVQVFSFTGDGKTKTCRVHDLVRDMIFKKNVDGSSPNNSIWFHQFDGEC